MVGGLSEVDRSAGMAMSLGWNMSDSASYIPNAQLRAKDMLFSVALLLLLKEEKDGTVHRLLWFSAE